jgi:hypothetical protein
MSYWYCLLYICQSFLLLKPLLCRTRAVGDRELTRFCRVSNSLKPVLRGWCYKTISVSALCNSMHKPTWGFGMLYTFVHYVRASLLAVLISYVAGSYPPPREAVITKYWVQNRTTSYFSSRANFVECTISLSLRGAPVRYQVRPCGAYGGHSGTETGFTLSTAVFFRSASSFQCPILVFL